jgi:hypothetical protein
MKKKPKIGKKYYWKHVGQRNNHGRLGELKL